MNKKLFLCSACAAVSQTAADSGTHRAAGSACAIQHAAKRPIHAATFTRNGVSAGAAISRVRGSDQDIVFIYTLDLVPPNGEP